MVRPAGSRLFCGSQTGQAGPPPQTRGPYAPRKGRFAARRPDGARPPTATRQRDPARGPGTRCMRGASALPAKVLRTSLWPRILGRTSPYRFDRRAVWRSMKPPRSPDLAIAARAAWRTQRGSGWSTRPCSASTTTTGSRGDDD